MKKLILLFLYFSIYTLSAQETIYRYIADGNDDGYEIHDISVNLDSEYMEMGWVGFSNYVLAIRYLDISIPPGSEILSAHIQFTSFEANPDTLRIHFSCQEDVNPPPFLNELNNLYDRQGTWPGEIWHIPAWQAFEPGQAQRTPDIKESVQQVIDSPGWTSGNPMVFLFRGTSNTGFMPKKVYSYEYMGDMYAPILTIEFNDPFAVEEHISQASMNITPNPVSKEFSVLFRDLQAGFYEICIYDLTGQKAYKIHEGILDQGDHQFSLAADEVHLHAGIYFVSLTGEIGNIVGKIIVQ